MNNFNYGSWLRCCARGNIVQVISRISRIEGSNYVENKIKHNEYLWFNPHVAKKRFINLYSTGMYE